MSCESSLRPLQCIQCTGLRFTHSRFAFRQCALPPSSHDSCHTGSRVLCSLVHAKHNSLHSGFQTTNHQGTLNFLTSMHHPSSFALNRCWVCKMYPSSRPLSPPLFVATKGTLGTVRSSQRRRSEQQLKQRQCPQAQPDGERYCREGDQPPGASSSRSHRQASSQS
jgi:hypothetical protein